MRDVSILNNIIASVFTSAAVAGLFVMWINSRFSALKDQIKSLRADLQRFEDSKKDWVEKEDYTEVRREDRESAIQMENRIEKKLDGLNKKVDEMPHQIVDMIKTFIK